MSDFFDCAANCMPIKSALGPSGDKRSPLVHYASRVLAPCLPKPCYLQHDGTTGNAHRSSQRRTSGCGPQLERTRPLQCHLSDESDVCSSLGESACVAIGSGF